jgi:hypothetical protein
MNCSRTTSMNWCPASANPNSMGNMDDDYVPTFGVSPLNLTTGPLGSCFTLRSTKHDLKLDIKGHPYANGQIHF